MKSIQDIGRPLVHPENRSELGRMPAAVLETVVPEILAAVDEFLAERTAESLLRLEENVLQALRFAASHIVGAVVSFLHRDAEWVKAAVRTLSDLASRPLRHRGRRSTPVRFLGGARLCLDTPYLSEDRRQRPGKRRRVGRRGAAGTGSYPVLEALGIRAQATPALASEVARQTVRCGSIEEAHQALAERGVQLDRKTVRTLALKVGEEALAQRDARGLAAACSTACSEELAGRRIVVSADGGRIRLREGGKCGRKGKKGRRRFRTPWREPKVVTVYTIDDIGRRDREVRPIYDGTLEDADAAFAILITELRLRGAARATEIILAADGAPWIWNRADELARALGLPPERIVKVADFYHAVQHLIEVADLCPRWDEERRNRWVRRMRRHLKHGEVDTVVDAIRGLCRGRNARALRTELAYFEDRKALMRYDEFRRRGIPLGSGAVESAIRRVVNLRLKGASVFWRRRNAERMLHLRCYLKAGRWDELMLRVLHRSPLAGSPEDALCDAA
jgi:hypothetical protein